MAPTAKVDNDDELRRVKDVNKDEAPARRHVRDSFKDIQLNLDHILFKVIKKVEKKIELVFLFALHSQSNWV